MSPRFALWWLLLAAVRASTVHVPGLGTVRGTSSQTAWSGRTVLEFRGIHFAQPPSGERRFKEPVRAGPWSGTKDATKFGQACPQPSVQSAGPDPEDCLTLDVHTPTTTPSAPLPVLVFFHGGGFMSGTSAVLRPSYLLEKDVVLVTPQYRVGVLGFFHLNTAEAPGNAGLADQLMALQWVRDHIAAFGGDPGRVTIAGSSAGAASVSLHMLSPRSRGLFQQVVSQSGSALAQWALDEARGEAHSGRVAALAGCHAHLPACMRNVSVASIVRAALTHSLLERRSARQGMGAMMPTLQHAAPGVDPFISASPRVTLERGDYEPLPLLMGVTKHEGVFTLDLSYQYYLVPNQLVQNTQYLRDDMISMMLSQYEVGDTSRVMADAVRRLYFNEEDLGNFTRMIPSLVDFSGVALIKGPSLRQAELHSSRANTFLYSFDHYGAQTLLKQTNATVPIKGGITHSDDTIYLFPRTQTPLNARDTEVAKKMVHLFTNFVIHGNPTPGPSSVAGVPRWPTYDRLEKTYLSIGSSAHLQHDLRVTFTDAKVNGIEHRPREVSRRHAHRISG